MMTLPSSLGIIINNSLYILLFNDSIILFVAGSSGAWWPIPARIYSAAAHCSERLCHRYGKQRLRTDDTAMPKISL